MSLKKKIAIGFFISAFIIAILVAFEYANLIKIRREVQYLEVTDTVSRKSLQLRRHEKNYFLYSPAKADEESAAVHRYLDEIRRLLAESIEVNRPEVNQDQVRSLGDAVTEYDQRFSDIEKQTQDIRRLFERLLVHGGQHTALLTLMNATFLERPGHVADLLEKTLHPMSGDSLVARLRIVDREITGLRKTGEDILFVSKDLDKTARERTEQVIHSAQIAILIFFPLFIIVGLGTLLLISANVVRRIRLMLATIGRTGRGAYGHVESAGESIGNDEVGQLITEFNRMEDLLAQRAIEIERKNNELIQTRKLAAIGTLAAGVAHELNNPLNNISLSAQVLARASAESSSPVVRDTVKDIIGESARVKRIVGDLLEFARGREPQLKPIAIDELIGECFRKLAVDTSRIKFSLRNNKPGRTLMVDPSQIEQVFINLFTNAVEAMPDSGSLAVSIDSEDEAMRIQISDTGGGMTPEAIEKAFEPFFTTKEKGTGLGLAIVFNIIRKHYGEIRITSESGKGTTFSIILPNQR